MSVKVVPAYGQSTLCDVLPAVAAHLGVPGMVDRLDLPASRRYVVLLVDGLGLSLVRAHLRDAPYFSELFGDVREITAGVPTTTATSITSLGTGRPPGHHGIAGYTFREPASGVRMNALTWENGPDAVESFQPHDTVFESMAMHGVRCTSIVLPRFAGTGLTRAALRGAEFVGVGDGDDEARIAAVAEAAASGDRSCVYVYERRLDHVGHGLGTASPAWRATLRLVDGFAERLRADLPDDVVLLITGDHGMVDVPAGTRIVLDEVPGLLKGVDLVAGEARFRQLYTGRAQQVARRFAEFLGERAWVLTRDEAMAEGWFGATPATVACRFGDVLVAMRGTWALMSREFPQEFGLVGMHGSLTPDEAAVPLFVDAPAHDSVWGGGG